MLCRPCALLGGGGFGYSFEEALSLTLPQIDNLTRSANKTNGRPKPWPGVDDRHTKLDLIDRGEANDAILQSIARQLNSG